MRGPAATAAEASGRRRTAAADREKGSSMAKYLLAYHGGTMPEDPTESARVMGLWVEWYTSLGAAVLDPGNPVGHAAYVSPDGSVSAGGGANPVSGYTLIEAGSLDEAVAAAKRNPLLAGGGSIEVAETFTMG
jgi:hypothetical protein